MAKTLGQLLSDRTASDAEIIEAVKSADKREREKQWDTWYKYTTDKYAFTPVEWRQQAARNIKLLGGKR